MFSRKQEPSLLLRAMAARFVKRLDFVLITSGVGELMEQFGITTAPALVVRKMSGETEVFTGKLEAPSLSEFLRRFAQDGAQADANRCGLSPPGRAAALHVSHILHGVLACSDLDGRRAARSCSLLLQEEHRRRNSTSLLTNPEISECHAGSAATAVEFRRGRLALSLHP